MEQCYEHQEGKVERKARTLLAFAAWHNHYGPGNSAAAVNEDSANWSSPDEKGFRANEQDFKKATVFIVVSVLWLMDAYVALRPNSPKCLLHMRSARNY